MDFGCLKKFDDRLKIVPCDEKHWKKLLGRMPKDMPEIQHTNIEFGAQMARSRGSKFAISIDHDELIYPLNDLTEFLKGEGLNSKADLFRVSPLEAIFELPVDTLSTPFEARWFRMLMSSDRDYKRRIRKLSFWLAVRLRFMNLFSRRGFLGHTQGRAYLGSPPRSPNGGSTIRKAMSLKFRGKNLIVQIFCTSTQCHMITGIRNGTVEQWGTLKQPLFQEDENFKPY